MTWIVADDWERRPLGQCAQWLSGGTPRKSCAEYWGGSIPWISAKSLDSFFVSDSDLRVTDLGAQNGTRLVPANTILFIVRGMSLKTEFRMGITTRQVAFNQDLKALIPLDGVDPHFLAYAIRAQTPIILGLVDEAGHGTGRLATDLLQALELPLPPLDEQRRIAAVLGALDDKIELNRKMNRTLEEMAQALFKSWFIDFDGVPASELVESELGPIPRGWAVKEIGKTVKIVGGATPSTKNAAFWDGGIHCWTTPKDLSSATCPLLLDTARRITDAGLAKISSGLLPSDTFLLSSRAPVGYTAIAKVPLAVNQGYIACPPGGRLTPLYLLHWARANLDIIKSRASGTTFAEISKQSFRPIPVVVPPKMRLDEFEQVVGALFSKIENNEQQSRTLAALRDALLPKLISGEIRVPEAEEAVEALR